MMSDAFEFATHDACETLTATVAQDPARTFVVRKRYRSGSSIWGQTDLPDRVFLLDSGRVDIVSVTADGDEHLHRVVGPGELFGEMCFCPHRHEPHGSIARSIGPSEVSATSYSEFRRTLRADESLVDSVLRTFCQRVSESEERQRILACKDARERLARLLIHLAAGARPVNGPGSDVGLPVTHAQLATLAALSRPHVSVIMAEFRTRGLVSYDRAGPLAVRPEGLRSAFT